MVLTMTQTGELTECLAELGGSATPSMVRRDRRFKSVRGVSTKALQNARLSLFRFVALRRAYSGMEQVLEHPDEKGQILSSFQATAPGRVGRLGDRVSVLRTRSWTGARVPVGCTYSISAANWDRFARRLSLCTPRDLDAARRRRLRDLRARLRHCAAGTARTARDQAGRDPRHRSRWRLERGIAAPCQRPPLAERSRSRRTRPD